MSTEETLEILRELEETDFTDDVKTWIRRTLLGMNKLALTEEEIEYGKSLQPLAEECLDSDYTPTEEVRLLQELGLANDIKGLYMLVSTMALKEIKRISCDNPKVVDRNAIEEMLKVMGNIGEKLEQGQATPIAHKQCDAINTIIFSAPYKWDDNKT